MSFNPYPRIKEWLDDMHFNSYDEAYRWIYNHNGGRVLRAQYTALEYYFRNQFVELPFVPLQPPSPQEVTRAIQGEPQFRLEPEAPPEFEEAPEVQNFAQRIFNRLRGLFG